MRTVAIIQTRMGSTRLPGKVAMDICGKPMLAHVVERARCIPEVDEVVVATSTSKGDDTVESICRSLSVPVFRGSEDDVLDRYLCAAREHKADVVVRITSDCPLLDPKISSLVVRGFLLEKPDYASNTLVRTYPRGLDTEVLPLKLLEVADGAAVSKEDREHVTRFVWRQPERFHLLSIKSEHDQSHHRWTVDTLEDLDLVRLILSQQRGALLCMADILTLFGENPDWFEINAQIRQKLL